MEKIKHLSLCSQLSKIIGVNITSLKRHDIYDDPGFFFDHILKLDKCYVNFCQVTEKNEARYQLLLKLNKFLSNSNYFIPSEANIINHNDQRWFYEIIPIFDKSYTKMTVEELKKFWYNLDQLNEEANSCTIDLDIIEKNNQFFKEIVYYEEMKLFFPDEFTNHNIKLKNLYMNFVDVEKVFELNRIYNYKVTGLQSFLPSPSEYARVVSTIWSSFCDSDEVLKTKLSLLNNNIITIINYCKNINFNYYTIDIKKLINHYERIELLWSEIYGRK